MAKKKKDMSKNRSKAREKIKKKRALRLSKSRSKPETKIINRPGMPYMGAPEGFRSISISQAMMEYAKPLMKFIKNEKGFNDAMNIVMMLWNYSLSGESSHEDKKIEKKILQTLKVTLDLDENEAHALFTEMVERHSYLFPQDKQPKPGTPFMFIRKEVRYLIRPFDYTKIVLSNEVIPPDKKDRDIINKINRLDSYIHDETEYERYEDLILSLKDECQNRFEKWLIAKGLKDDPTLFSFCLDIFFDFIYGYLHDDIIALKSIPDIYIVEFFEDFLLRKMMVEPNEYIYWPPALKLFYQFLYEKGYLENHEEIIKKIDQIEPYFIEVLKKQFS